MITEGMCLVVLSEGKRKEVITTSLKGKTEEKKEMFFKINV